MSKRAYRRQVRRSSFTNDVSIIDRCVSPDVLCCYCDAMAVAVSISDPDHLACLEHSKELPNVPLLLRQPTAPVRIR